jgi:UrcA family protein
MKSLFASAAFALLVAPALAGSVAVTGMTPTLGDGQVLKRIVVNFDDLNPADSQGASALYTRLNAVALKLCSSNQGGTGALLADKVEKCRVKAVKQAVKEIGTDQLAAAAAK